MDPSISHNGILSNIGVLFQDDIIFLTSYENKGQLNNPNFKNNELLCLLLFSYLVSVSEGKPLECYTFWISKFFVIVDPYSNDSKIIFYISYTRK